MTNEDDIKLLARAQLLCFKQDFEELLRKYPNIRIQLNQYLYPDISIKYYHNNQYITEDGFNVR